MNIRLKKFVSSDSFLIGIVMAVGISFRLSLASYLSQLREGLVLYIPDDAFYYFSIARNFARGLGFSIDGIHSTNGMHPLWLLAITPFFAFSSGNSALSGIIYFQAALDCIIVFLIADTVRVYLANAHSTNRKTAMTIAAALYIAAPGFFLRSSLGMETTLTALFIVLWLRQLRKFSPDRNLRFWLLLGILTGLLFLARTDMFVLVLPAVLWVGLRFRRELPWKKVVFGGAIAFFVVLPWLVWNMIHFGSIVQSSAEAVALFAMKKYAVMYGPVGMYRQLLLVAIRNIFKPFIASTFGVSILTILCALFRNRKDDRHDVTILLLLLAGGMLLLAIHSLFRGFIREWYVEELIPLFLVGFGVSMGYNAGRTAASIRGRIALGLIVLAAIFYYKPRTIQFWQLPMGKSVENILPGMEKGSKIGAFNSGIYSYYSPQTYRIVNLDGVVNADVIPYLKRGNLHDYLTKDSIEYVMDFQGTIGGYVGLFDRHLLDDYTILTRHPWGEDTFIVYQRKEFK
jgi:hypothetical protein